MTTNREDADEQARKDELRDWWLIQDATGHTIVHKNEQTARYLARAYDELWPHLTPHRVVRVREVVE